MAASQTDSRLVAARYAAALFDLATEKNAVDAVRADLLAVRSALSGTGQEKTPFSAMLSNPLVGRAQGKEAVTSLLSKAGAQALTQNFFGTLAQNRRLDVTAAAIDLFLELVAKARGEVTAKITSAQALSDKDKETLAASLSKKLGKTVLIDAATDERLLGGLTIEAAGKIMDYSVRGKLDRLALQLKNAALVAA